MTPSFDVEPREYVSTAAVAAALGVSVTTVKRWVDTGVLPAYRTAGGHRKLLRADVVRLSREGLLPQADLTRLGSTARLTRATDPAVLSDQMVEALRVGDADGLRRLVREVYQAGLAIDALADQIISPAMARIGHEWSQGEIDVLHEHRGTQLLAGALFELKAEVERNAERQRPVAVGGAIEQDHYVLPSLLAQLALADNGWDAVNIGPNTPFSSFARALEELQPRLVWVSISYLADVEQFERGYREFFKLARERGVAVAVGGRALPDNIRSRIPYTAYGDGLGHLVAFARTLHPRPKPPRRGRPPLNRLGNS